MAETVGKYILEEELKDGVEYCQRSKSFRLKLNMAMTSLPANVSRALKACTKEMVTMFAGKKTRIRILPAALLEGKMIHDLRALCLTYSFKDWSIRMLGEITERREKLGKDFYKQIQR